MQITISIKDNARVIANAEVYFDSAVLGNYTVRAMTYPNKIKGTRNKIHEFTLTDPNPNSGAWNLVELIAAELARREAEEE